MNRSIATGSADNMVSVIASSGRMTLDQIEAASEQMETEAVSLILNFHFNFLGSGPPPSS